MPDSSTWTATAVVGAFGAFIATLALVSGAIKLFKDEVNRRRDNAESLWREYELLCIEHPRFAAPTENKISLDLDRLELDGSTSKFTQYEYFVSFLIYACEGIIDAYEGTRPDWKLSVMEALGWHKAYLTSDYFQPYLPTVSPTVKKLITEMRLGG